ncbi:MAG TPA: sulfurtransferase [Pseudonocardiaceae bacterium]|jgi:thiosulfate/3-mercaptopyruvate sulfurtransferase|nr:sulfurtransferase [Pseudonocardiaceae bacterium]
MHPVIEPHELAEQLGAPEPPILLDVRWTLGGPSGRTDYQAGHLPGAVFLDVDTELAGPPGAAGRHPLPDPDALQATLRSAGVRSTVPVVAYDAADGSVAARVWWLLRWAGHPTVAVLDGGFAAWRAAGLPVSTAVPAPRAGTITVRPGGMPVLDANQAARLAREGVLLDARAAPRYQGMTEPVDPRAGHVPGARNAPFGELTDPQGCWLSTARLRELARGWGVVGGELGAYCGSGITACALVLGMELAGVTTPEQPVALYAGSWSQWCTDPARPVATGPSPG